MAPGEAAAGAPRPDLFPAARRLTSAASGQVCISPVLT